MPTVSIVVPMYNVEKYVERCLDSLITQTFRDIEIICVDDGSPDSSGSIAETYAEKDDRIRVLHKENAGLGYARNTGMENARGKYVTFVDSDDYISKSLVYDMVSAVETYNVDTVIAGYSRKMNNEITKIENPIAGKVYFEEEIIPSVLHKMVGPLGDGSDSLNMAAWRVLYSLDIIRDHQLRYPSEREFISEDIIFNLYYYRYARKVCGIENAGYIYCMNPGSLTEKYNSERFEKCVILFKEKVRLLKEMGAYTSDAKFRVEESFVRYSRYAIKSEVKFVSENGVTITRSNLRRIVSNDILLEIVEKHENPSKSRLDKMMDWCIKHHWGGLLYFLLSVGYKLRRSK